jgi:hypothetical protein
MKKLQKTEMKLKRNTLVWLDTPMFRKMMRMAKPLFIGKFRN